MLQIDWVSRVYHDHIQTLEKKLSESRARILELEKKLNPKHEDELGRFVRNDPAH